MSIRRESLPAGIREQADGCVLQDRPLFAVRTVREAGRAAGFPGHLVAVEVPSTRTPPSPPGRARTSQPTPASVPLPRPDRAGREAPRWRP